VKNLRLEKPLIVFDLETTGVDTDRDRIVEIAAVKVLPDGSRESRRRLVNPGIPIPAGATAVHGITDEDVRDAPSFSKIAQGFLDFLGDGDLAGFNVARFDVPMLARELRDCGLDLNAGARRVIDAMTIYHRKERRDLSAAVKFFLGRDHEGAHSADADVDATLDVLEAQLARYDDLPNTVAELDRWQRNVPENAVDAGGKFVWENGVAVVAFGKHKGRSLEEMVKKHRGYLEWIRGADFPEDAREIVQQALAGSFPTRSGAD